MSDDNSSNNDPIGKALGVNPLSKIDSIEKTVKALEMQSLADSANNDFQIARNNIHNIIESGSQALDELLMVASQSQHPRAYEVISTLIKTLVDANKDLLELQKKIRDLADPEQPSTGPKTINNNLIITTAELTRMIETARNNTKVIDQ
jgi:hypothetical protein